MVAAMLEDCGQCDLRIAPVAALDAGRRAHLRVAPVGADHKASLQWSEALAGEAHAVRLRFNRADETGDHAQAGSFGRLLGEKPGQVGILDIPAEGLQPDLGGPELDRRLAEQAAAVIDEAHHFQRRCLFQQGVLHAELGQHPPGTVEQGDGASVTRRRDRAEQGDAAAFPAQRQRGRQADGAGAHDGDIDLIGSVRAHRPWLADARRLGHGPQSRKVRSALGTDAFPAR